MNNIKKSICEFYLTKIACLSIVTMLFSIVSLQAEELLPYELYYQSKIAKIKLKSVRTLKKNGEGYQLKQVGKAMMSSISESSNFTLVDDNIIPIQYDYHRKITAAGKKYRVSFDASQHTSTYSEKNGKKSKTIEAPNRVYDALNYQLQIRLDLQKFGSKYPLSEYIVSNRGRLKTYRFQYVKDEVLKTELGNLDTIVIERVRDKNNKITKMWMAKDWDYVLVKILHEADSKNELNLQKGMVNNKAIK
ncbi:MAG: DUF3108 domain-containing protein [Gammaproteobacteria bacterium]|nr:DUF3108 domain-containing protein [Gammaproteobacteria bacterium]